MEKEYARIAILGGGPSALFLFKNLLALKPKGVEVSIFERKEILGAGMPYSEEGAQQEHVTNVSDNEIPNLLLSIEEWTKIAPQNLLDEYKINHSNFNEFKVLPRLFFGQYLSHQFKQLIALSKELNIITHVHLNCNIVDVEDNPENNTINLKDENNNNYEFDFLVICSGHNWSADKQPEKKGYYNSPYPPSKLNGKFNHAVAIRGSSLTAIDAIKTLANNHGVFINKDNGEKVYHLNDDAQNFKLVMHSRNGLLPAVRFHLQDSHLSGKGLLTEEQLKVHKENNNGFIDLDYFFDKNFKEIFIKEDLDFYQKIKNLSLEGFVEEMMKVREKVDAFDLLKAEYIEAEKSIKRQSSIYWKELLAILSFTLNYPAKYLSAEDMLRLKKTLMPLISVIIAFVPQSSCEVLLALHKAGILELIEVGNENDLNEEERGGVTLSYQDETGNKISNHYKTFIDCIGQPHLNIDDFPFKSLVENETINSAYVKFKDKNIGGKLYDVDEKVIKFDNEDFYLKVPGIAINDNFQVLNKFGEVNNRIFLMAVPYIGGFNPDYSGLDFSDAASKKVSKCLSELILK